MPISTDDIHDQSLKDALRSALSDRRLSYGDAIQLIRATFDQGGITNQEKEDLRRIADESSTMPPQGKELIRDFLRQLGGLTTDTTGGSKIFRYFLRRAQGAAANGNREADRLAAEVMGRPGVGAFPRITRREIGIGLWCNTRMPDLMAQGPSSLCGPTSLMFHLARDNPVAYCRFAIGLFERGQAYLGRLLITAGSDLRAYDPPNLRIAPVDWITTASIRDSENWLCDYQSVDDAFAGITLPNHMEKWFRMLGYTRVVNDTNLVVDKDIGNAQRANRYYQQGYRVCLFIGANMLSAANQASGSASADHWVVLTSPMTLTQQSVRFTVFTWGHGNWQVPQGGTLSRDDFLDNYYGFVAAKY